MRRRCTESGDRRTTWKPRCARPGCNAPAVPLSKYCTDWCGITVAATRLELADKLLPIEAFWQRVDGARKRDGAAVVEPFVGAVVNGTAVQDATDVEMSQLAATLKDDLDRLETKRNGVENTLSLVLSRLEFLRFAVDRWEAMCVATARALAQQAEAGGVEGSPARKGAAKGKGKRPSGAGAGTSSAEAPCGFDVRLVWDDRDCGSSLTVVRISRWMLMPSPSIHRGSVGQLGRRTINSRRGRRLRWRR